jgi:hypothetical protein
MKSPLPLIGTDTPSKRGDFSQGPLHGGVYVYSTTDGNFSIAHTAGSVLKPRVLLSQDRFARIFGRVPARGLPLRADVLIRMCRLGDVLPKIVGSDGSSLAGDILIKTHDAAAADSDQGYCLTFTPDSNLRLETTSVAELRANPEGYPLDYDAFEATFGFEVRLFFANEVLRLLRLRDLELEFEDTKVVVNA